ncbi:MAG: hypothetical protein R2909_03230 [Gemmatimonadales bacterium]
MSARQPGVRAGAAAAALLAISACGAAAPRPERHLLAIEAGAFVPALIAAQPGDTVVWINRDPVPHTVAANDGSWDSGNLAPNDTFRVVFDGTPVGYACRYHPLMVGSLGPPTER